SLVAALRKLEALATATKYSSCRVEGSLLLMASTVPARYQSTPGAERYVHTLPRSRTGPVDQARLPAPSRRPPRRTAGALRPHAGMPDRRCRQGPVCPPDAEPEYGCHADHQTGTAATARR